MIVHISTLIFLAVGSSLCYLDLDQILFPLCLVTLSMTNGLISWSNIYIYQES